MIRGWKAGAAFGAALLLALVSGVQAQAPSETPRQQRVDCSTAKDRKACARRALCAQSGNPAKCEQDAKRRAAQGARLPAKK